MNECSLLWTPFQWHQTQTKKYDVMMTTLLNETGYVNNIFYGWRGGCERERTPYRSFSLPKVISATRKNPNSLTKNSQNFLSLMLVLIACRSLKNRYRPLCFSQRGTKFRAALYQIKSNEKSSNNSKKIHSHTFISSALNVLKNHVLTSLSARENPWLALEKHFNMRQRATREASKYTI